MIDGETADRGEGGRQGENPCKKESHSPNGQKRNGISGYKNTLREKKKKGNTKKIKFFSKTQKSLRRGRNCNRGKKKTTTNKKHIYFKTITLNKKDRSHRMTNPEF